jgi:hypothetical protein
MITTAAASSRHSASDSGTPAPVAATEQRLYDAETALHAAQQTHVDAWVAAAYDRLHEAVLAHTEAVSRTPGR